MSMYRSRNYRSRWRSSWPWNRLLPPRVDERFCQKCRMPFHDGPMPKELTSFLADNVAVLVFPAGSWRKEEFVIRVGRWRAGGKQFYCSEFIPAADIDSLIAAAVMAKEGLPACRTRARRELVCK
jgi:hypothetical protein